MSTMQTRNNPQRIPPTNWKMPKNQKSSQGQMGKTCTQTKPGSRLHLLRLLARLPVRLAPLLTLLLLTLRLRFLRLTGEGLDSEELTAFALSFFSTLSEPLESEAAGLAFVFASFFRGFASLSESLATGLLLFSGLLLTGDFTLTG